MLNAPPVVPPTVVRKLVEGVYADPAQVPLVNAMALLFKAISVEIVPPGFPDVLEISAPVAATLIFPVPEISLPSLTSKRIPLPSTRLPVKEVLAEILTVPEAWLSTRSPALIVKPVPALGVTVPTVRLPAPVFVSIPEVVRAPKVRSFAPVLIVPPLAPIERALADIATAEDEVLTRVAPLPLRLIGPVPNLPAPSICTVPPVMVTPPVKSLAEVSTKVPAPDFAILVPPVILSAAVGPLKV